MTFTDPDVLLSEDGARAFSSTSDAGSATPPLIMATWGAQGFGMVAISLRVSLIFEIPKILLVHASKSKHVPVGLDDLFGLGPVSLSA